MGLELLDRRRRKPGSLCGLCDRLPTWSAASRDSETSRKTEDETASRARLSKQTMMTMVSCLSVTASSNAVAIPKTAVLRSCF